MIHERLGPVFKAHVDRVSSQVATLLWPGRRLACAGDWLARHPEHRDSAVLRLSRPK